MHLALPTRKSSNPPSYVARTSRFPTFRRSRVQAIVLCAVGIGAVFFIISQVFGGPERAPSGTPPVVIVTVVDQSHSSKEYIENIKENRIEYAKKHGRSPLSVMLGKANIPRLCDVPTTHHRLQPSWISKDMGSNTCSSTCTHQVSPQHVLLVS